MKTLKANQLMITNETTTTITEVEVIETTINAQKAITTETKDMIINSKKNSTLLKLKLPKLMTKLLL